MNYMEADYVAAVQWARAMLADPGVIILDTETTGLYDGAEIVEIAIINVAGEVLLDERLRPSRPIPPEATTIHHITDADVVNAPTWPEIAERVGQLLRAASKVVIYNSDYDHRILSQTCKFWGLSLLDLVPNASWNCAMHWYAQWYGDWSDYHSSYRWQPLPSANHSAKGDALATLAVIQRMAKGD